MTCEICKHGIAQTNAINWNPLRKRICATCESSVSFYVNLEGAARSNLKLSKNDFREILNYQMSVPFSSFKRYAKLTMDEFLQKIETFIESLNDEERASILERIYYKGL